MAGAVAAMLLSRCTVPVIYLHIAATAERQRQGALAAGNGNASHDAAA